MKELNRKNHILKNKKVASKYKIIQLATALMISFFFQFFQLISYWDIFRKPGASIISMSSRKKIQKLGI